MKNEDYIKSKKYGGRIPKRQLTPEQKRRRGRLMIMQIIKEFAIKNNMPDPFPVDPEEKERFETYKKEIIAKETELEYWNNFVRSHEWIHEYIEEEKLKEIVDGKPDKKNWTDTQWHAFMMKNVLLKMIEEKSKEEANE